jgi:hypothetical protein
MASSASRYGKRFLPISQNDAEPFHRGDAQKAAPFVHPSCQTLGVMRTLVISLLFCASTASLAAGVPLADDDRAALMQRAALYVKAFDEADAEAYIALTHPAIYRLVTDKAELLPAVKRVMKRIHSVRIVTESYSLYPPEECYASGTQLVCFLRRVIVTVLDGKREEGQSYLLAGRDTSNAGPWLFLDSDGFRQSPQRLFEFFPALPPDAKPPPIEVVPK